MKGTEGKIHALIFPKKEFDPEKEMKVMQDKINALEMHINESQLPKKVETGLSVMQDKINALEMHINESQLPKELETGLSVMQNKISVLETIITELCAAINKPIPPPEKSACEAKGQNSANS